MYCFIDSVFRIYLEIILELFFFHFADCCRQTMRLRIEHLKIPEFSVCYVCFKISTRPIKIKWIKGVPIMLEFLRLVYSLRFWKKNVHEALIWTLKNFRLSNSNMASASTSRLARSGLAALADPRPPRSASAQCWSGQLVSLRRYAAILLYILLERSMIYHWRAPIKSKII